jgi:hypothetical protein
MLWDTKKFNTEIAKLKKLADKSSLPSLRKEQIKQAILEKIKEPQESTKPEGVFWYNQHTHFIRFALAGMVGIFFIGGTAFASNSSVPGDLLYPVKQVKEKIEVSLSTSTERKAKLRSHFAEERLKELSRLRIQTVEKPTENYSNRQNYENEAKNNLQNAVEILTDVKAQLEAKGHTQAASSVSETLLKLQGKHEGGVEIEINFTGASSASPTEVKIKTEELKKENPNKEEDRVKGEFIKDKKPENNEKEIPGRQKQDLEIKKVENKKTGKPPLFED